MKRSELRNYIRETILNKLDEAATQDDVQNQKDYNAELEKTAELTDIEESVKKKG